MAENKNSRVIRFSKDKWLSLMAYIGIGCIAVSLLLTLVLANNSSLSQAFRRIGECIAYIISIIVAFNWVRTHKHVAWIVCYVIFVVTIVVLFILDAVGV
ncbi:MAG: hypothetical protein IJY90_01475 [Clostridia bacterium]|nr:hypothetical protein [Clostridia bacterium]